MRRNERLSAASRREFVAAAGLGAAVLAVPAMARSAEPSMREPVPLPLLAGASTAEWRQRIGQVFLVPQSGARLTLRAIEPATAAGSAALRRRTGFAALFESVDERAPAGDTIYALARPGEGSVALHLGPRVAAGGASRYVAVFG